MVDERLKLHRQKSNVQSGKIVLAKRYSADVKIVREIII